jgi:hypothetical protein
MIDPKDSLDELLAKFEQAQISSNREKLSAIISFSDRFIPEMSESTKDEFLIHVASIRADAIDLLAEYDKVSGNGKGERLNGLNARVLELLNFTEYLFALRYPEKVEQAHEAL